MADLPFGEFRIDELTNIPLSKLTHEQAAQNIIALAADDRLIQNSWQDQNNEGQRVACLLGAMHSGINDSHNCPAKLMPRWLADVIPAAYDSMTNDEYRVYAVKFADYLTRWSVLTTKQWNEVQRLIVVSLVEKAIALYNKNNKKWPNIVYEDKDGNDQQINEQDLCRQALTLIQNNNKKKLAAFSETNLELLRDEATSSPSYILTCYIEDGSLPEEMDATTVDGTPFFDSLFESLDRVLPDAVEQEYEFDVEYVATKRVKATAKGIVYARIEAMNQVPKSLDAIAVKSK